MPRQEIFSTQVDGDVRVEVVKVYDRAFAREAFTDMDEAARIYLWNALGIDETFDAMDNQDLYDLDREDVLWEELVDAAREDGNLFSFFVVNECVGSFNRTLYVSPDWPSADAFARSRQTKAV